jgi:hypothetical protein
MIARRDDGLGRLHYINRFACGARQARGSVHHQETAAGATAEDLHRGRHRRRRHRRLAARCRPLARSAPRRRSGDIHGRRRHRCPRQPGEGGERPHGGWPHSPDRNGSGGDGRRLEPGDRHRQQHGRDGPSGRRRIHSFVLESAPPGMAPAGAAAGRFALARSPSRRRRAGARRHRLGARRHASPRRDFSQPPTIRPPCPRCGMWARRRRRRSSTSSTT